MDYRKVIEGQIEELQERQKNLEGKPIEIECALEIAKTISELAVTASELVHQKEQKVKGVLECSGTLNSNSFRGE